MTDGRPFATAFSSGAPNNVNVVGQYYSAGPPPPAENRGQRSRRLIRRHVVTSPSLTTLCDGTASNNGHFSDTLAVENAQTPRYTSTGICRVPKSMRFFFENRSRGGGFTSNTRRSHIIYIQTFYLPPGLNCPFLVVRHHTFRNVSITGVVHQR